MKTFKFNILHTSDVHGKIYPYNYTDKKESTCLANTSTAINNLRQKNTILIDTGDLIQGSALTYFHNKNKEDTFNPMAKVYNYLQYDYFILGNHEFNYGQKYLNKFLNDLDAKVILNNVYKNDKCMFSPYKIHTYDNGFKVAIIGSVIENVPLWERDYNIKGLVFKSALDETLKTIDYIKKFDKVDCIIYAYHGGFEINPHTFEKNDIIRENIAYELLETNEDIDAILTGHQHRLYVGVKNGIAYTQPKCNGEYIGEISFEYELKNNVWTKKNSIANLIDTSSFAIDNKILEINKNLEFETQQWLDCELGSLKDGAIIPTTPLNDRVDINKLFILINKVQIDASGADIACTSLGNIFLGLDKVITPRMILNNYKYSNSIVVLSMKGSALLRALEQNSKFFILDNGSIKINPEYESPKREYYNYDVYYGIDYTIDLKEKVGNRITAYYKGKKIIKDNEYRIVTNNYRASGGGNFDMFKEARVVKEIRKEMTELIIDYVQKHKSISLNGCDNIRILT